MTAKIISIAQAKGGVGKSTICANLATTLYQDARVMIIDCDPPQLSLTAWFKVRTDLYEDTGLVSKVANTSTQLLSLIEKNKNEFDYILIDGAPHVNSLVRAMMLVSHLLLVPLAPSSIEVWSFSSLETLLKRAHKLNKNMITHICWNRVRKRVKSSDQIIQDLAKKSEIKALKNQLTFRVAYMDSFTEGCSAFEWTDAVASAEIWSLSSAIERILRKAPPLKLPRSAAAKQFIKKG